MGKLASAFHLWRDCGFERLLLYAASRRSEACYARTLSFMRRLWGLQARDRMVCRRVLDYKMYLDLDDEGLSRQLLTRGTRETKQVEIWRGMLKPGMRVVEVGSNIGFYALMEARDVGPEGKVYAVEPIPRNFEILQRNIELNHFEHLIESHCMAMSSRKGEAQMAATRSGNFSTMFLDRSDMSDWMRKTVAEEVREMITVPTLTLDEFLRDKEPVDMIRMDTEGYEVEILKGMRETLAGDRPLSLFMELHPVLFRDTTPVRELVRDLIGHGLMPTHVVDTDGTETLPFTEDTVYDVICSEIAPGVFFTRGR